MVMYLIYLSINLFKISALGNAQSRTSEKQSFIMKTVHPAQPVVRAVEVTAAEVEAEVGAGGGGLPGVPPVAGHGAQVRRGWVLEARETGMAM